METALKESLINYFVQLVKTDAKWKEFLKNVERPLHALRNQSEQFRHVISNEVDDAEICRMEGVRDKLIFKINVGIENEISQILDELRRVKNHVEDLKIKLERLEIVRSDALVGEPNFKELVDGTPLRPRLDLLLEWAIESSRYHSQLYETIMENLIILDYKSEESVNTWIKSFEQNRQGRAHIEKTDDAPVTDFNVRDPFLGRLPYQLLVIHYFFITGILGFTQFLVKETVK